MSPKQRSSLSALARTDALTFQNYKDAAFVQAVNRAANLKVLSAIKTGKLRLVVPPSQPSARYTPRMDLIDDPSSSTMVAMFELPGISGNNIQISISDGAFTVWGERPAPYSTTVDPLPENPLSVANAISSGEMDVDQSSSSGSNNHPRTKVYTQELCFGTFSRTVPIPKGVKGTDVNANLRDGMLIVTYPKQSESPKPPKNSNSSSTNTNTSTNTSTSNANTIPNPPMPMLAAGTASQ